MPLMVYLFGLQAVYICQRAPQREAWSLQSKQEEAVFGSLHQLGKDELRP